MSEITEDTQTVIPEEPEAFQKVLPPETQPNQRDGCGCRIPALLTLFVVAVLVVVGLFLPPVDLWNQWFGTHYVVLSVEANATAEDGLTLSFSQANPGQNFGVALSSVPVDSFVSGSANAEWRSEEHTSE